jgi:hypothetical protein
MASAIARRTGGSIPIYEILDAIEYANKEIHTTYEWPWTKAEYNVPVVGSYVTGTVSVPVGSSTVTLDAGSGGTWDTTWTHKRIYMGQFNASYEIASFQTVLGVTTATLKQPTNFPTALINGSYIIYQDTYPLPSDCEYGGILLIVNTTMGYRLQYTPTYTLTRMNAFPRVFFNNFQTQFCDAGVDDTTKQVLIQFAPPPSANAVYKMVYRRRPPSLQGLASTPIVPESFDRAIELMAEYQVRYGQKTPLPGWMECKAEAYQLLNAMKRRVTISLYDAYTMYAQYPFYGTGSDSISGNGLMLGGPTI